MSIVKYYQSLFCLLAFGLGSAGKAATFAFTVGKPALTVSNKAPVLHYHSLDFTREPGAAVEQIPPKMEAPLYGTLSLGPQGTPTNINMVVEEKPGKAPVFIVDTNGAGEFSHDKPVKLEPFAYKLDSGETRTEYKGETTVWIHYGDGVVALTLALDWLDPNDVRRRGGKAELLYTLTPSRSGTVKLGAETYDALLVDTNAVGDFRLRPNSGILLCLDVNHTGQIDKYGEAFDISRPFNLKGVTYEVTHSEVSGQEITIEKSTQTVPEIPPPPDLRVGRPILPFTATTLDGKMVNFPADFAGRKVILVFWASWCGDCQAELPHLLKAYAKFHAQGLDVVGVSMDHPDSLAKLTAYMTAQKIAWPQIYDGKMWAGAISQQYAMDWIPTLFLVDGTTGKILADNDTLIGPQIEKTLAEKIVKK